MTTSNYLPQINPLEAHSDSGTSDSSSESFSETSHSERSRSETSLKSRAASKSEDSGEQSRSFKDEGLAFEHWSAEKVVAWAKQELDLPQSFLDLLLHHDLTGKRVQQTNFQIMAQFGFPLGPTQDFLHAASKLSEEEKGVRQWNTEFQEFLGDANSLSKFEKLSALARDFTHVAELYGKVIISEQFLPDSLRTVKSSNIGGIAGGKKYKTQGILFKFAVDVKVGSTWLYGYLERNDEKAMKASKHELKGLLNFLHAKVEGLHFPLMAIILYRGYVLSAQSLLPLKEHLYGSRDGGETVEHSNEKLNDLMNLAGYRLKLAEREVNPRNPTGVKFRSAFDIEGHLGSDDRFYAIDFGRVFPPEFPIPKYAGPNFRTTNRPFYNFLRPTFVQRYKPEHSLCSDALTNWIKFDPNRNQINSDCEKATIYLFKEILPQVVNALSNLSPQDENWITTVHQLGMNYRHLGHIRNHKDLSPEWRQVILTECIARVVKNGVNSRLREKMEALKIATVDPYLSAVAEYLKPILHVEPSVPQTLFLFTLQPTGKFVRRLLEDEVELLCDRIKKFDQEGIVTMLQDPNVHLFVNAMNKQWRLPLMVAIGCGNHDALVALLNCDSIHIDASVRDKSTALHEASKLGDNISIILLLYKKADFNHRNYDKKTPRDVAFALVRNPSVSDFQATWAIFDEYKSKKKEWLERHHDIISKLVLTTQEKRNRILPNKVQKENNSGKRYKIEPLPVTTWPAPKSASTLPMSLERQRPKGPAPVLIRSHSALPAAVTTRLVNPQKQRATVAVPINPGGAPFSTPNALASTQRAWVTPESRAARAPASTARRQKEQEAADAVAVAAEQATNAAPSDQQATDTIENLTIKQFTGSPGDRRVSSAKHSDIFSQLDGSDEEIKKKGPRIHNPFSKKTPQLPESGYVNDHVLVQNHNSSSSSEDGPNQNRPDPTIAGSDSAPKSPRSLRDGFRKKKGGDHTSGGGQDKDKKSNDTDTNLPLPDAPSSSLSRSGDKKGKNEAEPDQGKLKTEKSNSKSPKTSPKTSPKPGRAAHKAQSDGAGGGGKRGLGVGVSRLRIAKSGVTKTPVPQPPNGAQPSAPPVVITSSSPRGDALGTPPSSDSPTSGQGPNPLSASKRRLERQSMKPQQGLIGHAKQRGLEASMRRKARITNVEWESPHPELVFASATPLPSRSPSFWEVQVISESSPICIGLSTVSKRGAISQLLLYSFDFSSKFNSLEHPFCFPLDAFCRAAGYLETKVKQTEEDVTEQSWLYWTKTVREELDVSFFKCINDIDEENLQSGIDFPLFIQRLSQLTGIVFSEKIKYYSSVNDILEIEREDIVEMNPRVVHMDLIDYVEALTILINLGEIDFEERTQKHEIEKNLLLPAEKKKSHDHQPQKVLIRDDAHRARLKQAEVKIESKLTLNAIIDPEAYFIWAQTCYRLALAQEIPGRRRKQLDKASRKLELGATSCQNCDHDFWISVRIEFLKGLLSVETGHLYTTVDPETAEQYYDKALDTFKIVVRNFQLIRTGYLLARNHKTITRTPTTGDFNNQNVVSDTTPSCPSPSTCQNPDLLPSLTHSVHWHLPYTRAPADVLQTRSIIREALQWTRFLLLFWC